MGPAERLSRLEAAMRDACDQPGRGGVHRHVVGCWIRQVQEIRVRLPGPGRVLLSDLTGARFGPFEVVRLERSGQRSPWWLLRCLACGSEGVRMGCHVRASMAGTRKAKCKTCSATEPLPKRKPKITEREIAEWEARARGAGGAR